MTNYNRLKISKDEMINEIKEELIIYFKKGIINPKSFFNIDGISFNNIYDILKIHFILFKEVQDYILSLERTIRDIKNSTKLHKKLFKGEVRGNIDWNKTIEHRFNTMNNDKTKFVCDNIDKLYDIKENLVLKKVISIIYNIIHFEIDMKRFNDKSWYKNGEEMANIILNIYKKNIYIKRIDISNIEITDKMIFDVLNSRHKIYRDSAKILKLYKDIMNLDEEEIGKLFSETFIDLADENTVFELYSIFKYIRSRFPSENLKYNILDGEEECLAKIDDQEYIYEIYHDSIGKDDISFNIYKDDIENSDNLYLERKLESLNRKVSIYSELEDKNISDTIWSGRPDLLIFKIDKRTQTILEITIGEIKYTNDKNYMYTGLEELLEYIYLLRDKKGSYINYIPIKGLLFVDDISIKKSKFQNIEIINRSTISGLLKL